MSLDTQVFPGSSSPESNGAFEIPVHFTPEQRADAIQTVAPALFDIAISGEQDSVTLHSTDPFAADADVVYDIGVLEAEIEQMPGGTGWVIERHAAESDVVTTALLTRTVGEDQQFRFYSPRPLDGGIESERWRPSTTLEIDIACAGLVALAEVRRQREIARLNAALVEEPRITEASVPVAPQPAARRPEVTRAADDAHHYVERTEIDMDGYRRWQDEQYAKRVQSPGYAPLTERVKNFVSRFRRRP